MRTDPHDGAEQRRAVGAAICLHTVDRHAGMWFKDPMGNRRSGGQGSGRLDEVVAAARRAREARGHGYREQALKLFPWVCARCGREFTRATVHELTVHHKNHDHDCNPPDGSNWELLCLYCHDNEHMRYALAGTRDAAGAPDKATHRPFAALADLLGGKKPP